MFYGARRSLVIESPGVNSQKPFPSPGDLPHQGTESAFLVSPALVGGFFTIVPSGKPNDKNRDWNSGFFSLLYVSTSISRSRLREFSGDGSMHIPVEKIAIQEKEIQSLEPTPS